MVLDTRRRFRGRESREEVSVYDSPLSLCSTVSGRYMLIFPLSDSKASYLQ